MYNKLKIKGFRGFSEEQVLPIAIPDHIHNGSGLTIVVGANNTGKSTIWESFRALGSNHVSFTEGKRNKKANNQIFLSIENTLTGDRTFLQSLSNGGSETEKNNQNFSCFSLPSRRTFSPFFGKNQWDRKVYISNAMRLSSSRSERNDSFSFRLFDTNSSLEKREHFNKELKKVFDFIPQWTIEQSDTGQYYVKLIFNDSTHNSDGAGEGFLSVFTIVDALFDSEKESMIVIDEPELSLHPALQKRLFNLLLEYSRNRQIVIFTHSPFFINWKTLSNGTILARTTKQDDSIKIYTLSGKSKEAIKKLIEDIHNLRLLGLEANEAFFLEDNIILTEGQDDVLYYREYFQKKYPNINWNFFGWGVGGAEKMKLISSILKDLGFRKVIGILDRDKIDFCQNLEKEFPEYKFLTIPAKDVRDKEERKQKDAVSGLFKDVGELKQEYQNEMDTIENSIKTYLNVSPNS